ncbi:F0F1 ATP synthase subunit epsilon [Zavarzinia compransoris]|uniref:F0F1 ATP synthase subunit epsilon n=1 Tax=Zavarzinia marina TaxID=2911065 RepID=UPI001F2C1E9E|nr:F0F1 ATP synthase subunit epsilon [Zavarzinia marina]MCF4167605.1 F0F1 ATP synthase subunit epsilon [Zavarzinia marina]
MRLRIVTPLAVVVDATDVRSVRAEDESGAFGVLPRHADFLTALTLGVVTWTGRDGARHHCAVRRGILSVEGGDAVAVTTREAVPGDDLETLHETVMARFRADDEAERMEHVEATRLHLNAIRQIMAHLRPERPL